jgi:surfactin synthase thioesterase subunit
MRPGPGQLAWQPDRQTLLAQDQQRVKDRRSGRLISFHRGAHRAHAPLRLFCFHHAGGAASLFKNWGQCLDGTADVVAIQLPGREGRWQEALCSDPDAMIEAIADDLQSADDGRPCVLFGHSLGAALCFGVAQALWERGAPLLAGLILSAGAPFHSALAGLDPAPLDDDALLELVLSWGGISPEMLRHADLMRGMLARLRSDLTLAHALYQRQAGLAALPVPIVAMGGSEDPVVPVADLATWSRFTSRNFDHHVLPGGHFFLRDEQALFPVLSRVIASLSPSLPGFQSPSLRSEHVQYAA